MCHTNVFQWETLSLMNKIDELRTMVAAEQPDILLITEINPKHSQDHMPKEALQLQGYDLFTNQMTRRGVALYIQESLHASAED